MARRVCCRAPRADRLRARQNGTTADGTPSLDSAGPRARHSASLVSYAGSLYLFGGYAYGGESTFATLYPAYPRNTSGYPSLTSKYYLNDVWRYVIANNTWQQVRLRPAAPRPPCCAAC